MFVIIMLILVNLILALGMIWLPPVAGGEIGNLFVRIWLLFGILVFLGHYLHYKTDFENKVSTSCRDRTKVHRRSVPSAERDQVRRSVSPQ
jgi:hypothetical protein